MQNNLKKISLDNRCGSALIELTMVTPFVALLVIVIVQFAALFHQAIDNIGEVDFEASERVLRWEIDNSNRGFSRPCLEELGRRYGNEVSVIGNNVRFGFGYQQCEMMIPQEVFIVAGSICQN